MSGYYTLSFLLGASSIFAQLLLLKEILNAFSGNELLLGLTLCLWLFSSGAGTYLSKFLKNINFEKILPVIAIGAVYFLPLQITLVRYLRGIITTAGIPSLDTTVLIIFVSIALSACLFGSIFTALSFGVKESIKVSTLYIAECSGAVSGSIIYILFQYFNLTTMRSSAILMFLNLFTFMFFYYKLMKKRVIILLFSLPLLLFVFDPEKVTLKLAYPRQKIIDVLNSPYGTIVLAETERQKNLYENGMLLTSSRDTTRKEEAVHYAGVQRHRPLKVLIIGGGYSGFTEEVKKYSPLSIDYLDIDPWLIKITLKWFGYLHPPVKIHIEDPREFIKKNKGYDLIVLSAPDPVSGAINRYYTMEFFKDVKNALNKKGVFTFSISGSEVYLGEEMRKLASSVYRALHRTFKETLILPGDKLFFIASDEPLSEKIEELVKLRNIKTIYVNENYLKGRFSEEKLANVRTWVSALAQTSTDLHPAGYGYYLNVWIKQFSQKHLLTVIFGIILIFLSTYVIFASPNKTFSFLSFTTGFTEMSAEVNIILIFQLIYSTLYFDIGTLFSFFMLGMAAGGVIFKRSKKTHRVILITEVMSLFFFIIIALFVNFVDLHGFSLWNGRIIFSSLIFLTGFIAGGELSILFPAVSTKSDDSAPSVYSADLLGSCAGSAITAIVLIPSVGVVKTFYILSCIKFLSFVTLLIYFTGWSLPVPSRKWQVWIVMFLILTLIGVFTVSNKFNPYLYSFSKSGPQSVIFIGSILFALILATGIFKIPFNIIFKILQFSSLSLIAFYPVFRCFFKIPYLFCHVCPRQCAFGIFRKYTVVAGTISNTTKWPFCHMTCPIGIMYDAQPVAEKRIPAKLIEKLNTVRLVFLIFIPLIYFKAKFDESALTPPFLDIFTFMFKNEYSTNIIVLCSAFIFVIGGFLIPRFFCNLFCPIGAVKKLLEKKLSDSAPD